MTNLRDVYVRGKYRDVILPMTVIRRLDSLLEASKPKVLELKAKLEQAKITAPWDALCSAAGYAFCNASLFTLKELAGKTKSQTLESDFIEYLDSFSPEIPDTYDDKGGHTRSGNRKIHVAITCYN